jgi:pilus assembly protein Flp/PilA
LRETKTKVVFRDTSWGLLIFLDGPSLGTFHAPSGAENPNEEKSTMNNLKQLFTNLMREDSGQDLIEYALVAALVGLGAVAAMGTLKSAIATAFGSVSAHLTGRS